MLRYNVGRQSLDCSGGLALLRKTVSEGGKAPALGPHTGSVLLQLALGLCPVKVGMIYYGRKRLFLVWPSGIGRVVGKRRTGSS